MVISRARRNFRRFLGVVLLVSLMFFGSVAGLYAAIKLRYVKMIDVAPALIQVDVMQHQALASLSDQDHQFVITKKMLQQGFLSPLYGRAGLVMLEDLAKAGHAPSQTLQADLMLRFTPDKKHEAMAYYRLAANQGFIPARDKLEEAQKLAQK